MSSSQWITEANDQTFEVEVIERSRSGPVIVDFWAPWCGPCRSLTPALEAAVEARAGAVRLVKVNVDECPSIAATFQVQGVPAVKAFLDGAVVDEFVGAIDRRGIEAFLDRAFPSEVEQSLQRAEGMVAAGQAEAALGELASPLEDLHLRDQALVLQARAFTALGRMDDAEEALRQLTPGSPQAASAEALLQRFDLIRAAGTEDEAHWRRAVEASPDDLEARWALAGRLVASGDLEGALENLLEILTSSRTFKDDGARKAMLSIFEELGIDHELSHRFRRQMQIYL